MRFPYRNNCAGVVGLGLILAGAGCSSLSKSKDPFVFFPAPPEKPRVQFLTWASGAEQIEPPKSEFEKFLLGDEPFFSRAINKPYGIAVFDGVVYVCDTKGLSIVRLDFKNLTYSVFGTSGPGRVKKPINIAIDPLGFKFVVDPVRKQVLVFDPQDRYITAFGLPEPCHPVDVAIYQDELYVLDNDETCQIVVLDRTTGDVIRTFGGPGGEVGQFKLPNSLCVSPDGYLYVSDTHNWRIQKLTREGEPVWVKGTAGYRLGEFGRPRGIRVGPDGIVYVVDGATEIVQMFDSDGNVLMRFAGPGNMPGALGLPATLAIDSSSIPYFKKFVHDKFEPQYLMFVTSQYGERLVNVYAFGAFPDDYALSESETLTIPRISMEEGTGPVSGIEVPAPTQGAQKEQESEGKE